MGLQGLRILVIEDAPDIREVFTLLLRAEGAHVESAANGREALELGTSGDFDIVLSDLGLPDIPGDVLIRQLLASPASSSATAKPSRSANSWKSRSMPVIEA